MSGQTATGYAWECALAQELEERYKLARKPSKAFNTACTHFDVLPDGKKLEYLEAGEKAAEELGLLDRRLETGGEIAILDSSAGRKGNPVDVEVRTKKGVVGLSGKRNHDDLKHPRVSNDWGARWTGYEVGPEYRAWMRPIEERLEELKGQGKLFRDLGDEKDVLYLRTLCGIEDEMRRLWGAFDGPFAEKLWGFVMGDDHWRVAYIDRTGNREVVIQGVNPNGSLPCRMWEAGNSMEIVRQGSNVLFLTMGEWRMRWRLHSAKSRVEKSWKFAISLEGVPSHAGKNHYRL